MKKSQKNKSNLVTNIIFAVVYITFAIFVIYWLLSKTFTADAECTIKSTRYIETGGGGSFVGHSPRIVLTCQDHRRYELSKLPESQKNFHEFQNYLESHKGEKIKLTVAAIRDPFNDVYYVNDIDLTSLESDDD